MDRNEIKKNVRDMICDSINECGEFPDMQQIRDYLENEFSMGDEAEEFVIDCLN